MLQSFLVRDQLHDNITTNAGALMVAFDKKKLSNTLQDNK